LIQRLARIVLGADLRGLDETERRAMLDASATIESLAAENAALRDELERVKADCHNWQQQAGYAETWNQEHGAMIRELTAERDDWKRKANLYHYALTLLWDYGLVITLPGRMDAVRKIARDAIEAGAKIDDGLPHHAALGERENS
jgi:hypothetical protein